MRTINRSKPVLVTGANGYLASWIIKQLLDDGITVHATVRDKNQTKKYDHLLQIAAAEKGVLKIFEADLLMNGSFEQAMKNCELVIHTASPFKIQGIKNARKELLEPALQGTRNVLNTVSKTATVKRVVLTSSVVAIYGDNKDIEKTDDQIFTEKNWNTTSSERHQPYPYSKTLAEKEAWKIEDAQERWDLVVINPGFILGPALNKNSSGTSIDFMRDLGSGRFKMGIPEAINGVVDVRDAARAHILAGYTPQASGRYITVASTKSFKDIADVLREKYPSLPLPKNQVPKSLVWLMAPLLGVTHKFVERNFGVPIRFDNSKIQNDLGIQFIPFEQTVTDHMDQLITDGLVHPPKKNKS